MLFDSVLYLVYGVTAGPAWWNGFIVDKSFEVATIGTIVHVLPHGKNPLKYAVVYRHGCETSSCIVTVLCQGKNA